MVHCFCALSSSSRCAHYFRPTWLLSYSGTPIPKGRGEEFLYVSLEFYESWHCGEERGDAAREVSLQRREGTLHMGMRTSLSQECRWQGRSQCMGAWASATGSDHIWVDRFSLKLSFWKLEKHTNTYAAKQMFPFLLLFLLQYSKETHVCVVLSPVTN